MSPYPLPVKNPGCNQCEHSRIGWGPFTLYQSQLCLRGSTLLRKKGSQKENAHRSCAHFEAVPKTVGKAVLRTLGFT